MRVFGLEITRQKRIPLTPIGSGGGWQTLMSRPEGWFQRDISLDHDTTLSNWTVFACMTLIAGDVGKLRVKLLEKDSIGIWTEVDVPAFSPVLRKPNGFQTRQKFIESWILSKLSHGNTYVLLERDQRQVVVGMYVLDPSRVKPLVAQNGDIYYELQADTLSQVNSGPDEPVVVPASEIIHDRMWCLFHPLVGISPIYASGLAASQGLKIQHNSARFFANMSRPSGILTAPGEIKTELAEQYKRAWKENYGPGREGQTAVLGGGLKYESLTQSAADSQMVAQLQMTAEMICSTFHVPAYKVGVGQTPTYQNAETLNQIYYDTCLQPLIEAVEANLDEGIGLGSGPNKSLGTELDLDALLRMDQGALTAVLEKQVLSALRSPDEARAKLNLPPVAGGSSPMMQQQNYSLEALAKRDASADPFGKATPPIPPPPATDGARKMADALRTKFLEASVAA